MTRYILLLLFFLITIPVFSQKTLLIEKTGTKQKFWCKMEDPIKLRTKKDNLLLRGKIWDIGDSSISLASQGISTISLLDIKYVYRQHPWFTSAGKQLAIYSGAFFLIIAINHLINNEPVFSKDIFIVTGSVAVLSVISFSISQRRIRIGERWKIKVLDFRVH